MTERIMPDNGLEYEFDAIWSDADEVICLAQYYGVLGEEFTAWIEDRKLERPGERGR